MIRRRSLFHTLHISHLWIHIVLIIGAIFFFGPVLLTFSYSVQSYSQIEQLPPSLWPTPFAWDNFSGAIQSFPFWQDFYNTLVNYGIVSFIGTLLTAPLSAFALSRLRSRFRS